MKKAVFASLCSLLLAGSAYGMTCDPIVEVPVKTKVDVIDTNGNVVVNGQPGCAQSVREDGRVRVRIMMLFYSGNGAPNAGEREIAVFPHELVGR